MVKSPSLARASLVDEVQDAIKNLIFERRLRPGDPLPTEFELVDTLGVSRNSLREALKVLQATGVVVVRHGHGMTVGEMSLHALIAELVFHARLSAQGGTKELRNLMDLRSVLESSLVLRAGAIMRADDLATILEAVTDMEAAADDGQFSPASDKLFHEALYRPLDNPFVSQLLSAFWDVFALLEDDLPESGEPPTVIAASHRAIYDALARGDVQQASDDMAAHFDGIKRRLDPAPVREAAVRAAVEPTPAA